MATLPFPQAPSEPSHQHPPQLPAAGSSAPVLGQALALNGRPFLARQAQNGRICLKALRQPSEETQRGTDEP